MIRRWIRQWLGVISREDIVSAVAQAISDRAEWLRRVEIHQVNRSRYVPTPGAGTWQEIIRILHKHGHLMTAAEIHAKASTTTIGNYLPVMVECGALKIVGRRPRNPGDRGVQPYLYGLPEWQKQ